MPSLVKDTRKKEAVWLPGEYFVVIFSSRGIRGQLLYNEDPLVRSVLSDPLVTGKASPRGEVPAFAASAGCYLHSGKVF